MLLEDLNGRDHVGPLGVDEDKVKYVRRAELD